MSSNTPEPPQLVVTDIRVPFGTVFTVVSQVFAVLALWSLASWLFVSCVRFIVPS